MNFSGYDKIIWRINGTLLFFVALLGLISMGAMSSQLFFNFHWPYRAPDIVAKKADEKEERLTLGRFESLKGTEYMLSALTTAEEYSRVSFSGYGSNGIIRNYFLFNAKIKQGLWIWQGNKNQVISQSNVFDSAGEKASNKIIGLVFERKDNDLESGNSKSQSVDYYDFKTQKLIPILTQIDRVIGLKQSSSAELLVFYSKQGNSYFTSFNLQTLALGVEQVISSPR